MIKIEEVTVREFRGIRELTLRPNGESFVISGPNGSGKSGIVDAIDFALTGDVSRLKGRGTKDLTLKSHGPHVHKRNDPAAAEVLLTVRETVTGKSAVLSRNVRHPEKFTLEPDAAAVRKAVERAQEHPELTLARRDIIKFVITEPSNRAQEVQALLRLSRIGEIRRTLQTAQSKASGVASAATQAEEAAREELRRHLNVPTINADDFRIAVNKKRALLGLAPLGKIESDTDFSAGLGAKASGKPFSKASAVNDVAALQDAFTSNESGVKKAHAELHSAVEGLRSGSDGLSAINHLDLIQRGLELLDGSTCPLCDLEWPSLEQLREHLAGKADHARAAGELREQLRRLSAKLIGEFSAQRNAIQSVDVIARHLGNGDGAAALQAWATSLVQIETYLQSVPTLLEKFDEIGLATSIPAPAAESLRALAEQLAVIPDQSAAIDAQDFLSIAQDRYRRLIIEGAKAARAARIRDAAQAIYTRYCGVMDQSLQTLYDTVEGDFSAFYREINSDDESAFKAELVPSGGALDLKVDFYQLGMFPPGAYHSEGHQDGMGICLYLALIKQLFGADFQFAVLDDVVMSVDSNHRKQFCKLLTEQFPDVQFIITTHDRVWANQMVTSGLITRKRLARFYGWTVDGGPQVDEGDDYLDHIANDLANDDVPSAAGKLRRACEARLAELADLLRAPVRYRADGRYELGDLQPAVTKRHRELLERANKAANSWSNPEQVAKIADLQKARCAVVSDQQGENWVVNVAIHANDWADLSKQDFQPVVTEWSKFFGLFCCSNPECDAFIYIATSGVDEEELRCSCSAYALNLKCK